MANSARDLRYGRRGGAWAEGWSDDDEARYQAALAPKTPNPEPDDQTGDQPSLFDSDEPDK